MVDVPLDNIQSTRDIVISWRVFFLACRGASRAWVKHGPWLGQARLARFEDRCPHPIKLPVNLLLDLGWYILVGHFVGAVFEGATWQGRKHGL